MADEETESEEVEEAPSGGGGGNKLMVIMALLNLVAVGGIGAFLITNQNNQAAAAPAAPVAVARGAVNGPLIALDPLVVNLNVVGATRYLKVTAQVELPEGAVEAEFEPNKVPIRHRLLVELSGLTIEDTQGSEKKLKLQEDLRDKINEMLGAGTITRIMFTEFVVQ